MKNSSFIKTGLERYFIFIEINFIIYEFYNIKSTVFLFINVKLIWNIWAAFPKSIEA